MPDSVRQGFRLSNISWLKSPSHRHSLQRRLQFLALLLCALALGWMGIAIGASQIDISMPLQIVSAIWGDTTVHNTDQSMIHNIVLNIRLPRVTMAILVGATLAVSGASLQGVCRNPLADPGLLGISAGAAVGAVLVIVFAKYIPLLAVAGSYGVSIAAVFGAAITAFSVYYLARTNGDIQISMFLLAGVAINALCVAMIGGLSFLADDQALRLITFWMMGSLASATWESIFICAPALIVAMTGIYRKRNALNLILLGEANARFTGVDVERVKRQLLWLNAIAVGVAVAFSGIIGFIGLVVPHILRVSSDTNYRYLIVNSALLGAALLTLADVSSRMLIAPAELPIGILTSVIGAPFFIGLLVQQKRRRGFSI